MYKVESDFNYKDHRCVVIFGDMGFRCGYVGVPKGHLLYGKEYGSEMGVSYSELENEPTGKRGIIPVLCAAYSENDDVSMDMYFDVHGSLTYSGGGKRSTYPVESDLWWLGFDCGHYNDGYDLDLMEELWGYNDNIKERIRLERKYPYHEEFEVRTQEYVEQECRNLVDQIIEYMEKYHG